MTQDPEQTLFKVTCPGLLTKDFRPGGDGLLMRNMNPAEDPGGIVGVKLLVHIGPDVLWSRLGIYYETAAFKSAEAVALQYVKKLYAEGKTAGDCKLEVTMGGDSAFYECIGGSKLASSRDDTKLGEETADVTHDSSAQEEASAKATATATAIPADDLEVWGLTLEEESNSVEFQMQAILESAQRSTARIVNENPILHHSQKGADGMAKAATDIAAWASINTSLKKHDLDLEFTDEGLFPMTHPDGREGGRDTQHASDDFAGPEAGSQEHCLRLS